MMKSRDAFPPNGWMFLQPETRWEAPTWQSFNVVVQALIEHRKANPALAKQHNWALDWETVAKEVDAYNDARCRAHGWLDFVSDGGAQPVPFQFPQRPFAPVGVAAIASVKRVAAGVRTLLDWLGSGGRPVAKELANSRARVCVQCPQNGKGDWTRFFTKPASDQIKLQLEIRNDLKLETPDDDKLGVCEACLCPLKLKVWAPLPHILKEMDNSTKEKLVPDCWILKEAFAEKQKWIEGKKMLDSI